MKKILACLFAIAFLASCSMYTPISGSGPIGKKTGESTSVKFLGFGGDPTISEAIKDGNIENISTVEYSQSFWFIVSTSTVKVTGN
jgi:hypothetical protein